MERTSYGIAALGALAGAAGVVAAAGAAHGAADPLLKTASDMLLVHAAALLGIAVLARGGRWVTAAGLVIALGLALFAGDLARRALSGERLFPMAAPTGGTLLILGWLILAVACALRAARKEG